jgi:hypothetical protein
MVSWCVVRSGAMDGDDAARAISAHCLETVLFPMALGAAQIEASPPAVVLAALRLREDVRSYLESRAARHWNAVEAESFSEELGIVAAAVTLAHVAGDGPRTRDARDAIVLLAQVAAFEHSNARELHQDTSDALYPSGEDPVYAERARVAEEVFDRWRALDGSVAETLLAWVREVGAALSP